MTSTETDTPPGQAPSLHLPDGQSIPLIGLGLWQITEKAEFITAFDAAIAAGYRHFDTAQEYGNEALLGDCIRESDVAREALYLTTKVWVTNYGRERTTKSLDDSLRRLGTEYVDLVLLHFPIPVTGKRAWQALEELQAGDKARSIGVSNHAPRHLDRMWRYAAVKPTVNQVEMHVFQQQPELLGYCRDHDIAVEAYSPLAHARRMDDDTVARTARKHGKSYGQIMLRWCIQQGVVALPKSINTDRIRENIDIFDFALDETDMTALTQANRSMYTNNPLAHMVP